MTRSIYEFKEEDAFDFARHVRIDAKPHNGELFFKTCPYCNPKPTRDNIRSFSINLKTGQFKCLRASCNAHGNMLTLAKDFDFSLGTYIDEYYRPMKKYKQLQTPKKEIVPKPEAITYLTGRKISEEVIKRFQITVQTSHPNILVFPFFDEKGKIQFVKYRKTDYNRETDDNKEWCEANCRPILFGMMQCKTFDRLIITEGQLDSLSVATAGIENAVSVPTGANGFTWMPYCWNWINQFKEVIVFGDHEKGHITLLDELTKRLHMKVKHVREEDYMDCKDANEILQKHGSEQVRKCIERAIMQPIVSVICASKINPLNPYDMEKARTGFNCIDRMFYGGIPYGYVVVIGGEPGKGKSTFAQQMIINMMEYGNKAFLYSGELGNELIVGTMNLQVAGPGHVLSNTTIDGDPYYFISKTNMQAISNWYEEKLYMYDSSIITRSEREDLITIMDKSFMQYGTRIFLVDNLMTAVDLNISENDTEYSAQNRFMGEITDFAVSRNVIVILVAHFSKNSTTDNNNKISGSKKIVNLAGAVFSYEVDKDDDDKRLLKTTKNRAIGKLNTKGIEMYYEEKSKRIYGDGDDVNKELSWNERNDGFTEIEAGIPFDEVDL